MKLIKNQMIFLLIIEQAIFMTKNNRKDNAICKIDKNQGLGAPVAEPVAAPLILIVCGLFIGFTNGFFGGGGGLICVPVLTHALKLEQKSAHATAILIILPLSLISSLIYLRAGAFRAVEGGAAAAGVIAGGVLGALLLKKLSNKAAGIIFAIIMIAAGVRLVC
jgi:uncharacterized membrane protein YfcA